MSRIREITKDFPGVTVRGRSVDFGDRARFDTNSHRLTPEQGHLLRAVVLKVLEIARDPLGQKWLKRVIVEGFADPRGTYLHNLNLSLQRSERVLCVLLTSERGTGPLDDRDRLMIREMFLAGGSSFNSLKESLEESRRIELKLDMWFVLGSHARTANSTEFRDMRKRMEGRLHYLGGQGSPFNNAFVMQIGSFLVVEFGVTGNACFVFHGKDFKVDFAQRFIDIDWLKGKNNVKRLIHRANWEADFDAWLCPRLGYRPTGAAPAPVIDPPRVTTRVSRVVPQRISSEFSMEALKELVSEYDLTFKDHRAKGGSIWVSGPGIDEAVKRQLTAWGFRYSDRRRAWWQE